MSTPTRFLVGFDQFLPREWVDYALSLAGADVPAPQAAREFKAFLATRMRSQDLARKTANVLNRLWFSTDPGLQNMRQSALILLAQSEPRERLLLHWGMALMVFPLFREICLQIGRLNKLQGQFRTREVRDRVLEKAGNHGTLPRVLHRVIQTLANWDVICPVGSHIYAIRSQDNFPLLFQQWLLEAAVWATPSQRVLLDDLARLPELFPFDINENVRQIVSSSSRLVTERDGNNLVYVVYRQTTST